MRRLLSYVPVLAALTLGSTPAFAQTDRDALIKEGRYVAAASDCVACHTAPGRPAYSGGIAFTLPIGTIYSTNITPDPDHGIGKYSEADFARAIRQGIRPDGSTLYPAMPFPSYARLTDHDIHALYAYFHDAVKAEPLAAPENKVSWPLSMRFPLTLWRWAFAPAPSAARNTTLHQFSDPTLTRGAYLVEGPGHCGACHSPRGISMQEKGLTAADGSSFLSGGAAIDGWVPPSLRQENRTGLGRWNEDDIVLFLKTGRNRQGESFGGMSDAIKHGTQHLSEGDLHAMAKYLLVLKPADTKQADWVYNTQTASSLHKADFSERGAKIYIDNCAACHRTDGKGYAAVFPPLAGNPVLMGKDPASLVHIIQSGATLPGMEAAPSAITMPDFRNRLTDQQIADVVTFIRHAWGNNAPAISQEDVAALKKTMPERNLSNEAVPLN